MSSSLYWLPPPSTQKKNHIDYLKYQIGMYFDEDYNGANMEETVGEEIIPFLLGIISVGSKEQIEDAQELINAIKQYGKVQLIISC